MARRKKPPLPDINFLITTLQEDIPIRLFALREIPQAVVWAERGHIAIHENYRSRRRQSYHVISGEKTNLIRFCEKIGIPSDYVTASDFYKFWHLTWFPSIDQDQNLPFAG